MTEDELEKLYFDNLDLSRYDNWTGDRFNNFDFVGFCGTATSIARLRVEDMAVLRWRFIVGDFGE